MLSFLPLSHIAAQLLDIHGPLMWGYTVNKIVLNCFQCIIILFFQIYFAKPDAKTLHLGPYVGAPTDHLIIPFGKGICGQVAVSNENFVVPDVTAQDNYIACSFTVKSEIVVPLFVKGKNIGQIDIDSHVLDPFTAADERFLEFVNQQVATLF